MRRSKYDNMFSPGQIIGEWKVLDGKVHHGQRGRTFIRCLCLHCNKSSSMVPCHHLAKKKSTRCKWCNYSSAGRGKSQNPNWDGVGEVPKSYMTHASYSAMRLNEPYNINTAYANSIFNGSCTISGQSISFEDNSAKLVKIDNSKGYVTGNVQWVHSAVASALKKVSSDEFINMCLEVAKQHQLKKE